MDLLEILSAFDCQITGGSDYLWSCFGPAAHLLDISDDVTIVFDRGTQRVYQVSFYGSPEDSEDDLLITTWTHPEHRDAYLAERTARAIDDHEVQVMSLEEVIQAAGMLA